MRSAWVSTSSRSRPGRSRGCWSCGQLSESLRRHFPALRGRLAGRPLLPPVPWRAGLMQLVAGPGAQLDDPRLNDAAAELAEELLAHHGLAR